MNKKREARLNVLNKVIERFRIKGALGESSAVTIEELGLPLRFKDAICRHKECSSSSMENCLRRRRRALCRKSASAITVSVNYRRTPNTVLDAVKNYERSQDRWH